LGYCITDIKTFYWEMFVGIDLEFDYPYFFGGLYRYVCYNSYGLKTMEDLCSLIKR
jgi:hypothetical protein